MKSPTLHDVARAAGVSYATADRVLNQRGNVAEKSVRKVRSAMEQLGYVRNLAAANLSKGRTYRLVFVLPPRGHMFFARMHAHLDKAATHLKLARISVDVIEVAAFETQALTDAISRLSAHPPDGVAIVGLRRDDLAEPLARLARQGTRVVSLVSDLPEGSAAHYIGIDNAKAGRTAARLLGLAHGGQAGRVVVAAGSLDAVDHFDRLTGFRDVIARDFPHLSVQDVIETKDDPDVLRTQLIAQLAQGDVTAIYNVGAGNAGLIAALESARSRPRCCIVHELDALTRAALERNQIDIVIDQRPEVEMARALTILQALVDDLPPPPMPELIPAICLQDNLPDTYD